MTQTTQEPLPGLAETVPPTTVYVPPPAPPPIAGLNEAKAAAAANGAKAVMFLAEVFTNEEYDITERVQAAAELLQFLAKGPF